MRILSVILSILVLGAPLASSQAFPRSCQSIYKDCTKWCYANRGGPEMFQCKNTCREELQSAIGNGVFRREDGKIEHCLVLLSHLTTPASI